jgi:two-component system sensor histidine kinase AtoS
MRLGVKSTLLMVAAYSLLIGAFGYIVDRWLHGFEDTVVLETLKLLAREKTALLSERALGALAANDDHSSALLRERIEDLSLLTEFPSSITVVNAGGKVVASDRVGAGRTAATVAALFGTSAEVRVKTAGAPRFFEGREYVVEVPLVEGGRVAGYIEVEFPRSSAGRWFETARRQLLVAALLGLGGVVLLGGALQFQISRRAADVAQSLEEAIHGPPSAPTPPHRDEFARVVRAAGRVRQALGEARRETSRLQESFGALAQAMDMGVLLLRRNRELDFANPRALELFGSVSFAALRERWPAVRDSLESALSGVDDAASRPALVDLPGNAVARLRVEMFRLGGEECDEFLVLLNDPGILDALETDVRLASQLQGVARVYRTVAHELRAPLSAMMIHLDLLRESLTRPLPNPEAKESQERYVVVLRDELDRLNRSLTEALTQTLPSPDQRDRFDLREALGELGMLLAPQARRQGVDLRTKMPETPVVLVGYKDRLKQSFLNIAVNALEALPSGGRVDLEMQVQGAEVVVRISDDGPGIPEELLAQIYERDFTTKGTGSGIGLYVARSLVEMHAGQIEVASQVGRGTEVEVRLPIVVRG